MDNDKFVEIAKHLIVDYINKIIDRKCFIFGKITTNDVYVVWICKTLQNNKALLSTTFNDTRYYEVTYNGDKQEIYFDAYQKEFNKAVSLSEIEERMCK